MGEGGRPPVDWLQERANDCKNEHVIPDAKQVTEDKAAIERRFHLLGSL